MEKSAIRKIESFCVLILKYVFSFFIGYLSSKIGIKQGISPFSLSLLSISPFTKMNSFSIFIGIFIGYITKEFSIDNFKYICCCIIILAIVLLSGRNAYKKVYSPVLISIICFFVGFIFMFANELTIVAFLILVCESIICGCATFFIKYGYDSIKNKSQLNNKDMISINITTILLICAFDNYYIFSTSFSFVLIILSIYLCCYYFETKTALFYMSTLCAIPLILHPDNTFIYILFFIPATVTSILSRFEKRHIVTSYILTFFAVYTINFQNTNFSMLFSPLYAAIIYILIPKKKLELILSYYIPINHKKEEKQNCSELCETYNKASANLLKKIDNTTVTPIINKTIENKIRRFLHANHCKEISISNYYNENGRQIITIQCHKGRDFSSKKLKNKINQLSNNLVLKSENIEKNMLFCTFEQMDKFKIECFALYKAKKGETICGDNVTAFKCQNGKYYLIIADGMGSGKEAYNKSYNSITLIKKLLKSGSDIHSAIETVNGAIDLLKDNIGFSTIDLCKISLDNASAKFIKCGAAKSFILRDNTTFKINGGGFPVGLNDEISYTKELFQLENNDIILMTSDGVTLTDEKIQATLLLNHDKSIEQIAKSIMDETNCITDIKFEDDISVLVSCIKKQI